MKKITENELIENYTVPNGMILVRADKKPEKSAGGIYLAKVEQTKESTTVGTVLKKDKHFVTDFQDLEKLWNDIEIGDMVGFGAFAHIFAPIPRQLSVNISDEELNKLCLIKPRNILAVYKKDFIKEFGND